MADKTLAKRGVRVIREVASRELNDDGLGKGAADSPPGRQESAEQRHARIAEIAYRNAGKRGFAPGGELDDWLEAEREIAAEARDGGLV
jgi:hypothetical protein